MRGSIKIMCAAMDEAEDGGIIIRGVIDAESLPKLKTPEYQREVLPQSKLSDLVAAFESGGRVPDIELGMRGASYREHDDKTTYYLQSDVYIIDGLQRVSAGMVVMQKGGERKPHLGVVVHTCTTEVWERERFKILNANRARLSPNVLLRNRKHDSAAVDCIYHLTHDKSFVLKDRVSWNQRKSREQLLDAMVFMKVVASLHAHLGPNLSQGVDALAAGLDKTMSSIGRTTLCDNTKTFFDAVDQAWGLRSVVYTETAPQIRLNFLRTLARVFSDHPVFWRDTRLVIDRDIIAKLKMFSIHDPGIANLAGSSSSAAAILYQMIVNHVNSGKRTRRLVPRMNMAPELDSDEAEAASA